MFCYNPSHVSMYSACASARWFASARASARSLRIWATSTKLDRLKRRHRGQNRTVDRLLGSPSAILVGWQHSLIAARRIPFGSDWNRGLNATGRMEFRIRVWLGLLRPIGGVIPWLARALKSDDNRIDTLKNAWERAAPSLKKFKKRSGMSARMPHSLAGQCRRSLVLARVVS